MGDGLGPYEAAFVAVAEAVGHDDDFGLGGCEVAGEGCQAGGCATAVRGDIGEGVAEGT
jgi:hypothetical protein